MNILILEDNRDGADSLVRLLRAAGHRATVAGDGRAGLDHLRRGRFDGAIVDLMLPTLNGWEFLEEMDRNAATKVPVIVVSGYADVLPPSPFHHVPVLPKPADPALLLRLVDSNFGKGA